MEASEEQQREAYLKGITVIAEYFKDLGRLTQGGVPLSAIKGGIGRGIERLLEFSKATVHT
jgi:hypothetical protein